MRCRVNEEERSEIHENRATNGIMLLLYFTKKEKKGRNAITGSSVLGRNNKFCVIRICSWKM